MQPIRNLEENITYYFGAGASANAIPTIAGIIERIEEFRFFLNKMSESLTSPHSHTNIDRKVFSEFSMFCNYWSPFAIASPSIDTLAKRFADGHTGNDYSDYKLFLLVLFNYLHYFKQSEEKNSRDGGLISTRLEGRYENLIRSINQFDPRDVRKVIPDVFTFVSWNYDFQFELTIANDSKKKISQIEFENNMFLGNHLINLNGTSFVKNETIIEETQLRPEVVLQKLITIYQKVKNRDAYNPLKFSWESSEHNSYLELLATESNHVVVIGYSFPTFNRDVDNAFFHNLKPGTKVFTQGYDYADSVRIEKYLKQTFIDEKPPFKITPVESPFFYVPAEYFLKKKSYSMGVG